MRKKSLFLSALLASLENLKHCSKLSIEQAIVNYSYTANLANFLRKGKEVVLKNRFGRFLRI